MSLQSHTRTSSIGPRYGPIAVLLQPRNLKAPIETLKCSQEVCYRPVYPLMLTAAKSSLTTLMIICRQSKVKKRFDRNHYQHLSFKYFVKVCLIKKVLPIVSLIHTTIYKGARKHYWGNLSNAEATSIQSTRTQISLKNI